MQWLGNQSKRWFTFLASPCFKSGFAQNNGWLPFQHCQCAWQNREVASTMPNSISMVLGWKDALSQCNPIHSCPPSLWSLPSLWLSKCTHPAILIHLCVGMDSVWNWWNSPDSKDALSPQLVCCGFLFDWFLFACFHWFCCYLVCCCYTWWFLSH